MSNDIYIPIALCLMRVWLGSVFFIQSFDRVFNVGLKNVVETIEANSRKYHPSRKLVIFTSSFSSFIELVGGLLLILGLFKLSAVILLGINMILLSIIFSIRQPMWDMRHFLPRFLILILIMLTGEMNDVISIDHLIFKL